MSADKLLAMYKEELIYICGRSRDYHIYVYDKVSYANAVPGWIKGRVFDLGLVVVQCEHQRTNISDVQRLVVEEIPRQGRKKARYLKSYHWFEKHQLSGVSSVSWFIGEEDVVDSGTNEDTVKEE